MRTMQTHSSQSLASGPRHGALSLVRVAGWALGGLVVALAVALVYAALTFGMSLYPMPKDLQDLMTFLLVSGVVSVGLGAVGSLLGLGTRIPSLAITMAL